MSTSTSPVTQEAEVEVNSAVKKGVNSLLRAETGSISSIVPAAITAGNYAGFTTAGLYQNINGENGVIAKVEEQGIAVTGYVGGLPLRAKLRGKQRHRLLACDLLRAHQRHGALDARVHHHLTACERSHGARHGVNIGVLKVQRHAARRLHPHRSAKRQHCGNSDGTGTELWEKILKHE